jgi:hypothetical protein
MNTGFKRYNYAMTNPDDIYGYIGIDVFIFDVLYCIYYRYNKRDFNTITSISAECKLYKKRKPTGSNILEFETILHYDKCPFIEPNLTEQEYIDKISSLLLLL